MQFQRRPRGRNHAKKGTCPRRQPLLRGPVAGQMTHQHREVVREGRRELALGEILAATQPCPTVFPVVKHMAEAPFEVLATLS